MVIQRIYVHPPSAKPLPTTVAQTPPTLRKRSETLDTPEGKASSRSTSPSELGGTQTSPSTSKVAALRIQHTGGSFSERSDQTTSRPTSPSPSPSPYEGIRAPTTTSVLRPSDFAKRKSMFMQQATPSEPVKQFHAKLERHYSGVYKRASDGADGESSPKTDSPPSSIRGRTVSDAPEALKITLRKTGRLNGDLQPSPLSLSPASGLATPTSTTPTQTTNGELPSAGPKPSPRMENQVLDLTTRLQETASENKQLVSDISTLELAVEKLKGQHHEAQDTAAEISQVLQEETIPKSKFDELKADTEKKQKDLEQLAVKTKEGERTLQELLDRAATLKLTTVQKGAVIPIRKELEEREALEQAVERLKEQVEVATGATRDRRMSFSSQNSERTAPSATRIPLTRSRRATPSNNGSVVDITPSEPPTPTIPVPSISPPPPGRSRRAQIVSFCEPTSLPGREELERQITAFYEETRKVTVPPKPVSQVEKPKEEIGDVLAMIDGFADDGFNASVLSLNFPKAPMSPKSTSSKGRDSMSVRSGSVRSKKKGWGSLFKVKLPGSSVQEDRNSGRDNGPPTLAPIVQPSPITL